jgi:uncharacterized protein with PQ loop repeat
MGLSPVRQIRRMLRTRSSHDVSIGCFSVLNVGFVLWAGYGISIRNAAVVTPNVVAFGVGMATIAVALWLRADERREPASGSAEGQRGHVGSSPSE